MSFDDALDAIVPAGTREFTLSGVHVNCADPVVLVCKHAGFSNPALTSAQIKTFNARQGANANGKLSVDKMAADRASDAKLFAQHVVTGWRNVSETPGTPTPVTPAKVEEFLLSLARKRPDIFRVLTGWASDADNFTDTPLGDPETLGK